MDEIQQLRTILSQPALWQDDNVRSYSIHQQGGIAVEVVADPAGLRWRATWPDRSEAVSERTFDNAHDAKADLRAVLQDRLSDMSYAATPPATVGL